MHLPVSNPTRLVNNGNVFIETPWIPSLMQDLQLPHLGLSRHLVSPLHPISPPNRWTLSNGYPLQRGFRRWLPTRHPANSPPADRPLYLAPVHADRPLRTPLGQSLVNPPRPLLWPPECQVPPSPKRKQGGSLKPGSETPIGATRTRWSGWSAVQVSQPAPSS